MDAYFEEMLRRLHLTKAQKKDAKTKYDGVAKALHEEFYTSEYNGSTKLLIGSYGKHTNIRPPGDIDLLFKIPIDVYEQYVDYKGNGASALLQKVRNILADEYSTSEQPKAWGKVVLVTFGEGRHDVELLPAYGVGDGVYQIPNSENGGGFESFDVGADLAVVSDSNSLTGGLTRKLIRVIKCWRQRHDALHVKSFEIEAYVASYLESHSYNDVSWSELVSSFFEWLYIQPSLSSDDRSYVATAKQRAANALEHLSSGQESKAQEEWVKVFGMTFFPAYSKAKDRIYTLTKLWPSDEEEFIEDVYPVKIDPTITLTIDARVEMPSFITRPLNEFLARYNNHVPKGAKIFFAAKSNVSVPVRYLWKVRNFGTDASKVEGGMRGQINEREREISEDTRYRNDHHYVEVYLVRDDVIVAKQTLFVPIGDDA